MSSFTRFDGSLNITYCQEASMLLGKDYWLLRRSYVYYVGSVDSNVFVEVPYGFLSDGASVPFFARMFISTMGQHSQAAFLHDYLCETYKISKTTTSGNITIKVTRKEIDHIFFEALEVSGYPKWKILLVRAGVSAYRNIIRPKKPRVKSLKLEMEIKCRLMLDAQK